MKKLFILTLIGVAFLFLSCEEPDDPPIPYTYSTPILIGKSINSLDIFWNEATLKDFQSYDIFYRDLYSVEPKHYLTVTNKRMIYTSIVGLLPSTVYRIYVVTTDKSGNEYISTELSEMTLNDGPGPVTGFRLDFYHDTTYTFWVGFTWNEYLESYAVPFGRYELYMDVVSNFICSDHNRIETVTNYQITKAGFDIFEFPRERNYYFKLRTYNALGKYSESQVVAFWKPQYVPPGPLPSISE